MPRSKAAKRLLSVDAAGASKVLDVTSEKSNELIEGWFTSRTLSYCRQVQILGECRNVFGTRGLLDQPTQHGLNAATRLKVHIKNSHRAGN